MTTTQTGLLGERLARRFCIMQHWNMLHTNWRSGRGEIDIIAQDKDTTVFIEVKYRGNDRFGSPEEAITPQKQKMLRMTISAYLSRFPTPHFRVDVITITKQKPKPVLRHMKDVLLLQ